METKFKDVAHLYLGCNVQDDNTPSGYTAMLCSCDLSGDANIFYFDKNGNCDVDSNIVSIIEIKPILRPMSDITEVELSDLWRIVFTREFNGVIHKHKANDTGRGTYAAERYVMSSGVERLGVEFDGNVWAYSDLLIWRYNKHNITSCLLSKHFDLFGLIEGGEAIDKTKL